MLIHYATAAIADVAAQIGHASDRTEQNHQRSLATVQANANNFGGAGSDAFNAAISAINQKYAQSQATIQQAGRVLLEANNEMTHADQKSAGQYA
ncbi:WXG100 family type VII secretion target [Mycolicibacterium llatzerense]|uniref:WXG100 family type VII secretion target n=1 Tax=Mycolicibacterium llatzerense TaxID=280871 RepID=UPI0021B56610|nr:WXG100 family type VII secretion target [Mycolicibacterium llatzerense]MCT7367337.1 hypothetical protein [Mycolicibacterium llatzerense]